MGDSINSRFSVPKLIVQIVVMGDSGHGEGGADNR